MNGASLLRLLALSAIWGASFLFMRISVPALGPAWLIEVRVALAALFLAAVALWQRRPLAVGRHWRHYLILGGLNTALPFLLFAFAAQTLSASLLSILNATAPLWGSVIGAVVLRVRLDRKALLGLGLGLAGVALLTGFDESALRPGAGIAIAAALASASSGVAAPTDAAFVGEIALTGVVRPVSAMEQRIAAARASGIARVFAPVERGGRSHAFDVVPVHRVADAIAWSSASRRRASRDAATA